jgi:aspartyl/asparaginyl beta-hydroxylase (cupin superfamily)
MLLFAPQFRVLARGRIKAADKYDDCGFNSFFRTGWKR